MKVLFVTSELNTGGIEKLLYDYCSRMPDFEFDFAIICEEKGMLEEQFENLGCGIFRMVPTRKNPFLHMRQLSRIIKNSSYDVVHDHGGDKALPSMIVACFRGVPMRIAHVHGSYEPENLYKRTERAISTLLTKIFSTNLFACGKDAAKWMWGKSYDRGKVFIMRNAIDIKKYAYSEKKRQAWREDLNIKEKFVIGHVGRFSEEKNHAFLIDVFGEICKTRDDARLILIGDGELEEEVRQRVADMGLDGKVLFLGRQDDIPGLLSAMDVFVMTSHHEGLPVCMVEAQANGLPAVVSDAVTEEVVIAENIRRLALNASLSEWVAAVKENTTRLPVSDGLIKGFNIDDAVDALGKMYYGARRSK